MAQHPTWPDRLKWAEEQGLKNLQEKFTTADNMNKEAQTTLTYVLAATGVTFAYVFQALNAPLTVLVAACALMCIYYTLLGIILVARTLRIGEFPSPYQEPKNLTKDEHVPLDDVRSGEIRAITARIAEAHIWIGKKSRAINFVRTMLVVSPFFFVLAALICRPLI